MSEKSIKVTDRRMFDHEGHLREDFRHLEDIEPRPAVAETSDVAETSHLAATSSAAEPMMAPEREALAATVREVPALRTAPGYEEAEGRRGPQFMDLVGLLAEPASQYLRHAQAAQTGELRAVAEASRNLELARLHIDLMVVLREKSATNLTAQELTMLDDVIYRMQLAVTQSQGE